MAKKDTSSTVRDMLSTGRDLRPPRSSATAVSAPAEVPTTPEREGSPAGEEPSPPATAPPVRRAPGRPASTGTDAGAPRTLRLSQDAADELRAAWLEEKRHGEDVLLSLQEFASRVLADGMRVRGHKT